MRLWEPRDRGRNAPQIWQHDILWVQKDGDTDRAPAENDHAWTIDSTHLPHLQRHARNMLQPEPQRLPTLRRSWSPCVCKVERKTWAS